MNIDNYTQKGLDALEEQTERIAANLKYIEEHSVDATELSASKNNRQARHEPSRTRSPARAEILAWHAKRRQKRGSKA
jgi:hypothetical protein